MMLRWALAYAERLGWPLFPVHSMRPSGRCSCLDRACHSQAKHPRTPHGVDDATTDVAQIRDWWSRWPDANIGLAAGPSFWVLDCDGEPGEQSLSALILEHGWLPTGPVVLTGSGGKHFLMAPDTRVGNRVKVAPGLDVRAAGGYVVAVPSNHASGGRYQWISPPRADATLPAAPEWLLDLVSRRTPTIPAPPPVACTSAPDMVKRASRYLARLEPSVSGSGGHLALWRAAQVLVRRFRLTREQALWLLTVEFNPRCRPPWSEKQLLHKVLQAEQQGRMSALV